MPIWLGLLAVIGIIILMRIFKQESELNLLQEQKFAKENKE